MFRYFGRHWDLDFSDDALVEFYNHETFGLPISHNNGFSVGKQQLNLHVTMWKEDIRKGCLFKKELYEDGSFPHWWLDSIFKDGR